jgi:hypothetical protein
MSMQQAAVRKPEEQVLISYDELDKKVDIILSGDPNRKQFFENMKSLYYNYKFVNEVLLFFERNPAVSFNKGARDSTADILFCTADVYVPPNTIKSMINSKLYGNADVVFIVLPRFKRNKNIQFCSGAFTIDRLKMLAHPIPESPDFLEEILWQNSTLGTLNFKPYFGLFKHLHKHTLGHIFRFSRLRTNERAKLKHRGIISNFYVIIDLVFSVKEFISELRKRNPNTILQELLRQQHET